MIVFRTIGNISGNGVADKTSARCLWCVSSVNAKYEILPNAPTLGDYSTLRFDSHRLQQAEGVHARVRHAWEGAGAHTARINVHVLYRVRTERPCIAGEWPVI